MKKIVRDSKGLAVYLFYPNNQDYYRRFPIDDITLSQNKTQIMQNFGLEDLDIKDINLLWKEINLDKMGVTINEI